MRSDYLLAWCRAFRESLENDPPLAVRELLTIERNRISVTFYTHHPIPLDPSVSYQRNAPSKIQRVRACLSFLFHSDSSFEGDPGSSIQAISVCGQPSSPSAIQLPPQLQTTPTALVHHSCPIQILATRHGTLFTRYTLHHVLKPRELPVLRMSPMGPTRADIRLSSGHTLWMSYADSSRGPSHV